MVEVLTVIGLVIGVAAYALLIRRRGWFRAHASADRRELAASNAIGMARLRDASRLRAQALASKEDVRTAVIVPDRRSGKERRNGGTEGSQRRRSGRDRRGSSRSGSDES